jgi:hypothetical protein
MIEPWQFLETQINALRLPVLQEVAPALSTTDHAGSIRPRRISRVTPLLAIEAEVV